MNRRNTVVALAALGAAPMATRAQQAPRVARIGYLSITSAAAQARYFEPLRSGLRDLGYVEGKDYRIEPRFADGDNDKLAGLAAELVRLNVDVIVSYATGVIAARQATATIPIVMATHADPVATGLAVSLARPGGNVTGSTFFHSELMAKRLELLKEVVPSMTRAGVLLHRDNPSNGPALEAMGATARALRVELHPIETRGPADFERTFSTWAEKKIQGLAVSDHAQFTTNAATITALAAKRRLPVNGTLELAASGGLMAYGVNFPEQFRRAAYFVDKILKGARPADLPIEQATKFICVLNLKTARAFGLKFPQSVLVRADQVIE
ncbi:MAG: ABC transporter substrate-binding protein [Betaproteobacteria bacterium]|nr:ABC transporter substrate-binding protein [Betaproteobacteria bacterium]